jgi:hypothetical protein
MSEALDLALLLGNTMVYWWGLLRNAPSFLDLLRVLRAFVLKSCQKKREARNQANQQGGQQNMKKHALVAASILVLLCAVVCAGFEADPSDSAIKAKSYGGIPYVSGGVGLDEREALTRMSPDYNLKMSFAVTSGNYLGDVDIIIRDGGGKVVLEAVSEGPWFFSKLPAGKYTVTVKAMGQTQQHSVQVSAKGQSQLNLFWKG